MKLKITALFLFLLLSIGAQNKTDIAALEQLKKQAPVFQKDSNSSARNNSNKPKGYLGHMATIPIVISTRDLGANETSGIDQLQKNTNLSLQPTGKGVMIHQWDQGAVYTSHQEFKEGFITNDDSNDYSNHSTGVTATMIAQGIVVSATGAAKNAKVNTFSFLEKNLAEHILEKTKENPKGMLSNHSYGFNVGLYKSSDFQDNSKDAWYWLGDESLSSTESNYFGLYSQYDQYIDNMLYLSPFHSYIQAVGNTRGLSYFPPGTEHYYTKDGGRSWLKSTKTRAVNCANGYDCIAFGSTGKNNIQVGAVDEGSSNLSFFSSIGPTDDGRIKPDLVASGTNYYLPKNNNSEYQTLMKGTSFSAPLVTGGVALLQESFKFQHSRFMYSDEVKALICHTAKDIGNAGPDYRNGWGLFQAYEAAKVIDKNQNFALFERIEDQALNTTYTKTIYISDTSKPLKVTIAWLDPAASFNHNLLNSRSKKLVNDLDLVLIDPKGNEHLSWVLDVENPSVNATKGTNTIDNIEQVYIKSPMEGEYTLKVHFKKAQVNWDNKTTTTQSFALILTAATLSPFYVNIQSKEVSCIGKSDGEIILSPLLNNNYEYSINGKSSISFTEKIRIKNLTSGSYNLCVKNNTSDYQCYTVEIKEPKSLAVSTRLSNNGNTLELTLSGADKYYIVLNGKVFTSQEEKLTLALSPGKNSLKIYTDLSCRGSFKQDFTVTSKKINVYPNPITSGILYVSLPEKEQLIHLQFFDLDGRLIRSETYTEAIHTKTHSFSTQGIKNGYYLLRVQTNQQVKTFKIIVQ